MGLPGMDEAWAAGFSHSLPLRSPRPCGCWLDFFAAKGRKDLKEWKIGNKETWLARKSKNGKEKQDGDEGNER